MRALAPLLIASLPAVAEPLSVPSGQPLELIEALWDFSDAPALRLRLLAPEIGTVRDFAAVEADFLHLCRTLALPLLTADRADYLIIINLLDRPVPFGTTDPEATQFFEAYRAQDGDCIWEGL